MTHSLRASVLSSLTLIGLATGCDPAAALGETLGDSSSASRGMEALMGALSLGGPAGLARGEDSQFREAHGEIPGVDVPDVDQELEIDADAPCPGGGQMKITGQSKINTELGDLDDPEQAWGGTSAEFTLTVTFEGCELEGVLMQGDVTYEQKLEVSATDIDYDWSYSGLVEFSGAVEGSCEVDMAASYTGDGDEDEIGLGGRAYEGTMCGFDAGEVADDADF